MEQDFKGVLKTPFRLSFSFLSLPVGSNPPGGFCLRFFKYFSDSNLVVTFGFLAPLKQQASVFKEIIIRTSKTPQIHEKTCPCGVFLFADFRGFLCISNVLVTR